MSDVTAGLFAGLVLVIAWSLGGIRGALLRIADILERKP